MISQVLVGNHAAALTGFIAPPEPTYLLNALFRPTESLWKASGYESAELLKLIDDSYRVDDPAALKPILAQLQQVLARDCPAIWIGALEVQNLWRGNVKDFEVNTGFSLQLDNVYLANA
jgi:peptide/nickel transport system substrate-binding protein